MTSFKDYLLKEKEYLEKRIAELEAKKALYPEGSLNVHNMKGQYQYYQVCRQQGKKPPVRKYIRKADVKRAEDLAKKEFEKSLRDMYVSRLKTVKRAYNTYDLTDPGDLLHGLSDARRALIDSEYLTDEEYAKRWQDRPFKGKKLEDGSVEIITNRGECVRSKSEKIIADMLAEYRIPYKYEYPVRMYNGVIVYPDFYVLNKTTRAEYIFEHFGMMDSEDYAAKTALKINTYIKSGYFPGDNFIFTMETSNSPLNIRILKMIVEKYLL